MDDNSALPPPSPGPTWDEYSSTAFRVAWSLLHDEADAKDVAQEVLAALSIQEQAPRNPPAWITTVTKRRVADLLRERARELKRLERAVAQGAVQTIAPDIAADVVGQIHADELLSTLTPREREVIDLAIVDGAPRRETAEALDLSEESVKTLRSRGVGRMRRIEEEGRDS